MTFGVWILASLEESFPGAWTPGRVIFVVLSGALIGLSVTAIHELGHVIVGCLVGFRCSSMFIGPLQLHVPFRVSLHPDPRAWLHGGATLFPVERDRLRARGIALVFGPKAKLRP